MYYYRYTVILTNILLVAIFLNYIVYSSHHTDANTFSLQHYLNNTSKHFVSHNQFCFIYGGQYYINSDLIIKTINDFTITGLRISKYAAILCTLPANIVVINATNIKFINIAAMLNCIRNHNKDYLNSTLFGVYYARGSIPFSKTTNYYALLMLCNSSTSTVFHNITINTTTNSYKLYCYSICECKRQLNG